MFLNFIENNSLRALVGTFILIGSLICMWYCVYKYAVCQENIKRTNIIHSEIPRAYSSIEVRHHQAGLIVIPFESSQPDKLVGIV